MPGFRLLHELRRRRHVMRVVIAHAIAPIDVSSGTSAPVMSAQAELPNGSVGMANGSVKTTVGRLRHD